MRLLVLGASGGVGRLLVEQALARGHVVTAQTRRAAKLAELAERVRILEADPLDAAAIGRAVEGQEAVLDALGTDRLGPTTLFSESTRILLDAMARSGVRRLVAITGVGAGETRGHGGIWYDRVIFPLFTRRRYADKDRQEAAIRAAAVDWTIVRPAPFARTVPEAPLEVHETVPPDLVLRRVSREEVARFVLDRLEDPTSVGRVFFIGHP
ncbi:MAG: SDR family oxidoreductase [Geminicoccaceae bacterium]|nr:SDR family oxidoreductase [Geminicoccaceae bacterium]